MVYHELSGAEDGRVLVLSNSLGTSTALWDPQVDEFSEHLRVVRYDHRGHGRSAVSPGPYSLDDLGRDVLELLDYLAVERASICGVSLGGMVAMWLGIHAPDRIDRLVLCSTAAYLPPPSVWTERAQAVRNAGSTEVIADVVLGRWLTPAGRDADPQRYARLRAMLLQTSAEGYASCCGVLEHLDLRDQLSAIAAPTLVVVGTADVATPERHSRAIVDAIPDARFEVLDGAAHLANVERAESLTELVLEHCAAPAAAVDYRSK